MKSSTVINMSWLSPSLTEALAPAGWSSEGEAEGELVSMGRSTDGEDKTSSQDVRPFNHRINEVRSWWEEQERNGGVRGYLAADASLSNLSVF